MPIRFSGTYAALAEKERRLIAPRPVIECIRADGATSLRGIAEVLNAKWRTVQGGRLHLSTVLGVLWKD